MTGVTRADGATGVTVGTGRRRRVVVVLAVVCLAVGLLGVLAPHTFYRHVVGVDMLGPYNEHLLTDVGGFYLGFALLFAWCARSRSVELRRAGCAAFALTQVLHFAYHAAHLSHFSTVQASEQTIALGALMVLPVVGLL